MSEQEKNQMIWIGVDVSKNKIDVYDEFKQRHKTYFSHDLAPWLEILRTEYFGKNLAIAMESTGIYSKKLMIKLQENGFRVSILNAKQVRDFAKSQGHLAKTDKIDSSIICKFAQVFNPRVFEIKLEHLEKLKLYFKRRNSVVNSIKHQKNQLESCIDNEVRKMILSTIKYFEKQLEKIEKMIDNLYEKSSELKEKYDLIKSIPGAGKVLATAVIAEMPELGKISREKAAALAGVAPFNNDSGKKNGKRSIKGGRKHFRNILYMATISAIKCNPIIRSYYQKLTARGKPAKLAITNSMHKFLLIMNSMLASNKKWAV